MSGSKVRQGILLGVVPINNNPEKKHDGNDSYYLYDGDVYRIHYPLNQYANNGRSRTETLVSDVKNNMSVALVLLNADCLAVLRTVLAKGAA